MPRPAVLLGVLIALTVLFLIVGLPEGSDDQGDSASEGRSIPSWEANPSVNRPAERGLETTRGLAGPRPSRASPAPSAVAVAPCDRLAAIELGAKSFWSSREDQEAAEERARNALAAAGDPVAPPEVLLLDCEEQPCAAVVDLSGARKGPWVADLARHGFQPATGSVQVNEHEDVAVSYLWTEEVLAAAQEPMERLSRGYRVRLRTDALAVQAGLSLAGTDRSEFDLMMADDLILEQPEMLGREADSLCGPRRRGWFGAPLPPPTPHERREAERWLADLSRRCVTPPETWALDCQESPCIVWMAGSHSEVRGCADQEDDDAYAITQADLEPGRAIHARPLVPDERLDDPRVRRRLRARVAGRMWFWMGGIPLCDLWPTVEGLPAPWCGPPP